MYKTDFGCCICNHDQRTDIESALLAGQTVEAVADFYKVNTKALENHKCNCSIYLMSLDEFDQEVASQLVNLNHPGGQTLVQPGSIQRQLKLKEADLLAATAQEYMVTLKNLGRKINKALNDFEEEPMLSQMLLKKATCDMYVQIGGEIRQTVRTMAELSQLLNADSDESLAGLKALVGALQKHGD